MFDLQPHKMGACGGGVVSIPLSCSVVANMSPQIGIPKAKEERIMIHTIMVVVVVWFHVFGNFYNSDRFFLSHLPISKEPSLYAG